MPSSWWYHPTISSSVVPFSSCLQSFPALGSFPMSQFFTLGGQSSRVRKHSSVQLLSHVWLFATHGLQHARLPCPSPTARVCSNSCPSSWWYHPTISSSAVPFSSCLQSSPTSGSFVMSQFFVSGGQSIGWSFSFSISPSNEYSGLTSFRMDWLDLLAVQGTLNSILQQHSSKASILQRSAFFIVQLSHPYITTGKTIALTRQTFVGKVINVPAFEYAI